MTPPGTIKSSSQPRTQASIDEKLARIKAEAEDIEQHIRSARKDKDTRGMRTLQNRLLELRFERDRLEMKRSMGTAPEEQTQESTREVPAEAGDEAGDDPFPRALQRRTTVEDNREPPEPDPGDNNTGPRPSDVQQSNGEFGRLRLL